MPRDFSMNLALVTAPATFEIEAVKAIKAWEKIPFEVANPLEPLMARVYIPQITVKKLNATVTFEVEDVTVEAKPQVLQIAIVQGITAAGATGPLLVEAPFIPANFEAGANPGFQGPRLLTVKGTASSETATVTVSPKIVPFLQILNLARQ